MIIITLFLLYYLEKNIKYHSLILLLVYDNVYLNKYKINYL